MSQPDPARWPGEDRLTPTVAEIDLAALAHNLNVFRTRIGKADLMAVVKANAYGHGAERTALHLRDLGVRRFAVATLPEGIALRRAGIDDPVLVFAAPLPEYLEEYGRHGLGVTISSTNVAELVMERARKTPLKVHVKIDTGMHRLGIRPSEAGEVVAMLERAGSVTLEGIWTHFATSDHELLDFAYEQLETFRVATRDIRDAFGSIHLANSAAALRMPETYAFDRAVVRIGIGLYGYVDLDGLAEEWGLRPVMRLTSRVTHLQRIAAGESVSYGRQWRAARPTTIATVGAGYADGYPRLLSSRGQAVIAGERRGVAGTICMDMFMLDVGDGTDLEVGSEVVLFGPGGPDAAEVGAWSGTIAYEVLTGVSARVPRVYRTGPSLLV